MTLMTPKDIYINCPYDKSHTILLSRMQTHLVKCGKVNENAKLIICPFNATHKIKEPEFNFHVHYICADRSKFDNYVCKSEENAKPLIPMNKIEVIQEDCENWDNEEHVTYNPQEHIHDKPLLLYKQGATPSERKAFRAAERIRRQELMNREENNSQNSFSSSTKSSNQLRLPATQARASGINSEFMPTAHCSSTKTESPVKKSEDDFIVPRYARGRGRGRFTK